MDLYAIVSSLFAGFVSTAVMTVLEIPFWKRWGLTGILEWHENQILTCKFFRLAFFKKLMLTSIIQGRVAKCIEKASYGT